jgi:hypothetical protein
MRWPGSSSASTAGTSPWRRCGSFPPRWRR